MDFARGVENDATVRNALQNQVLITFDAGTPVGKEFVEKYGVAVYPTFIVLNDKGEVLHAWIGYGSAEKWSGVMDEIKADSITLETRKERFASAPTARNAILLGKAYRATGKYSNAVNYFDQALELDATAAKAAEVPFKRIRSLFSGASNGSISFPETVAATEKFLLDPDLDYDAGLWAANTLLRAAGQIGLERIGPLLQVAQTVMLNADDDPSRGDRMQFLAKYSLQIDEDPEQALIYCRRSLPVDWETNSSALNDFAWWCYEANINLEEAEEMARKGLELKAEDGFDKANSIDTLAQILFAQGKRAEAIEQIRLAITMVPDNDYFREQLKVFESNL
ncbi:MAG: tetratricopeptide repeat protein [bacterium]|nr:tetratricopeptide repeat protein [bacterium]